jgi:hypothetical protein
MDQCRQDFTLITPATVPTWHAPAADRHACIVDV